jgi:hypothetical protein
MFQIQLEFLLSLHQQIQKLPDEFARFEIELENGSGTGAVHDFATNRYYVASTQLQELYQTQGFTWNAVTVVKIYACAIVKMFLLKIIILLLTHLD